MVAAELARDGTDDVVARTWLNAEAGHRNPQPGELALTALDELRPAVEGALRQGARLWLARVCRTRGDVSRRRCTSSSSFRTSS
ncbi:hypothetical protein OOK58_36310 [Streptomyces sp. NBC_01728]|uniref:hypothetical protein n=1 Tax=unclassified Streptomyces TaxID=2593676 RepID=UPI002257B81C|nr:MULTISPECIES: hypothetical protein [unclassified Streptomyces]MCX4457424.1 hypothetical protein [Streptomyces sp. NBC_01719]MCX4496781.1 hypothetical protein [Streptomyces sp. NBC_01728]